jgi:hypothetical protein
MSIEDKDASIAKEVIDSLSRAVSRLNETGNVSSRSFANTVSYIFRKVIGN